MSSNREMSMMNKIMTVRSNYSRSISLSRVKMSRLIEFDQVLVLQQHSDIPLARLNPMDIERDARRVMIEDADGNSKLSPYFVYKF